VTPEAALSFAFDTMPVALVTEQTSFLLLFRCAATLAGGPAGRALLRRWFPGRPG